MNFKIAQQYILNIFNKYNFTHLAQQEKYHSTSICIQRCQNNSEIIITFPGYKTVVKTSGKVVFDYRVDLKRETGNSTSLSHANIVVDIYNKVVNCGMSIAALRDVLVSITVEGDIDIDEIKQKLPYSPSSPTQELLALAQKAHGNKTFNLSGNLLDIEIEELIASIKWIMLQEDLNYPIAESFLGRKMPLARYLETLFVIDSEQHTLEEVIQRTLSHSRPKNWNGMNYDFLGLIK